MNKSMMDWMWGLSGNAIGWAVLLLLDRTKRKCVKQNEFNDFHFDILALSEYTEQVNLLESCECLTQCPKEEKKIVWWNTSLKGCIKSSRGKKRVKKTNLRNKKLIWSPWELIYFSQDLNEVVKFSLQPFNHKTKHFQ